MSYHISQRKILFWKKLLNCDNIAVRTVVAVNRHSIGLIMSQYKLQSISIQMLAASRNLFGNVSLTKHMKMARFSFARPLVRVIYFVLTGVFYCLLCFIAFLVSCFY